MASKLKNKPLHQTSYPGVYYLEGKTLVEGKPEKVFYIRYRRDGKAVKEKAGRQYRDDMTAARANQIRVARLQGQEPSNRERRFLEEEQKKAEDNRWTFNRLWEEYKRVNSGLKAIAKDDNRYQVHLSKPFGNHEPSELTPLDLDNFRLSLVHKGASKGSIRNILELLRRIANFGVKKHLYPPLSLIIELPKVNSQRTEDLNPSQLQALFQAMDADENRQAANLMKMVLYTGMRRGELFSLQWKDVDFERGFIYIRGKIEEDGPKGGQTAKIPLNQPARELLSRHERPYPGSAFVFPGRGGAMRVDIKIPVNRIKARAGLPADFRALHGLRHVYASMLASSGQVDMYTLQKLLTHKSPQMTQRYAHLRDESRPLHSSR